jgi:predicted  nucleic acid-binding Zn-ribbon protein
MMLEELYDALIEAGASEEKARAASRAIADMEGHFANIERSISDLDHKMERLEQQIEGKLRLHDWMLGTILPFIIAMFFKMFSR